MARRRLLGGDGHMGRSDLAKPLVPNSNQEAPFCYQATSQRSCLETCYLPRLQGLQEKSPSRPHAGSTSRLQWAQWCPVTSIHSQQGHILAVAPSFDDGLLPSSMTSIVSRVYEPHCWAAKRNCGPNPHNPRSLNLEPCLHLPHAPSLQGAVCIFPHCS